MSRGPESLEGCIPATIGVRPGGWAMTGYFFAAIISSVVAATMAVTLPFENVHFGFVDTRLEKFLVGGAAALFVVPAIIAGAIKGADTYHDH